MIYRTGVTLLASFSDRTDRVPSNGFPAILSEIGIVIDCDSWLMLLTHFEEYCRSREGFAPISATFGLRYGVERAEQLLERYESLETQSLACTRAKEAITKLGNKLKINDLRAFRNQLWFRRCMTELIVLNLEGINGSEPRYGLSFAYYNKTSVELQSDLRSLVEKLNSVFPEAEGRIWINRRKGAHSQLLGVREMGSWVDSELSVLAA